MKYSSDELLLMDPVEVYKLRLSGVISRFPKNFFSEGNHPNMDVCIKLIKYLLEEKLEWSDEEICEKLSVQVFKDNRLAGMISHIFNNSPYEALSSAYPDKFKPWQLAVTPMNYWNKETAKMATIWLIEERLKWSDEEVCKKLSQQVFINNGLTGMINNIFNGSPYEALSSAYPNKFKPWQLSMTPINYWNKETAKMATIWLIEEKLKWSDEEICKNLSQQVFKNHGLAGMIYIFNDSTYEALNNAYPGKFKPWQLSMTPNNYWNKETAKMATIWLIEKKLKWSDEEICEKLSVQVFKNHGLSGMIYTIFNGSPYEALNNAYPGKFKKVKKRIKIE